MPSRTKTAAAEPEEGAAEHIVAAVHGSWQMIPCRQLVGDDNIRADLELDPEFLKSVKERGVLIPLMVHRITPPDGVTELEPGYRIDAGHRRHAAEIKARGIDSSVPCIVGDDLAAGDRMVLMLIENLRRTDLNPVDEARAMARAVEFGMTKKALAAAVGAPESTVSSRLKLLGLPAEILERVAKGDLDLHEAETLLKLLVLPKPLSAMKEVLKSGSYQLDNRVSSKVTSHQRNEFLEQVMTGLRDKGWAVGKTNAYLGRDTTVKGKKADGKQATLTPLKNLGLDGEAGRHAKERCKAKILSYDTYGPFKAYKEVPACSDPTRHTGTAIAGGEPIPPTSKLVAPSPEEVHKRTDSYGNQLSPEEIERREQARRDTELREEAKAHLTAFLGSLARGKAVSRAEWVDMLISQTAVEAVDRYAERVGPMLDLEPVMEDRRVWKSDHYEMVPQPTYRPVLDAYIEKSGANRERAAWCMALLNAWGQYQPGEQTPFMTWLEERGFERHPWEAEIAQRVAAEQAEVEAERAKIPAELKARIDKIVEVGEDVGWGEENLWSDVDEAFGYSDDDEAALASIEAMVAEWEEELEISTDAGVVDVGTHHPALNGEAAVEGEGDIDRKERTVGMYAGDEDHGDDITSGPAEDEDYDGESEDYDEDTSDLAYEGGDPAYDGE